MANERTTRVLGGGVNALLFYAGLEIQHNIFGDNCSSPQTTELRVGGAEGGGAAESTLMKWVHIASGKGLLLTGVVGFITGNWFSFLGAIVGVVDMQATYWYAKVCGRRLRGGSTLGKPTPGVQGGGTAPEKTPPLRPRP